MQHDVGRRAGGGEVRNAREPVGQRVLAGQHREHAGHGARRGDVDRADQRVGMRRAHRGAIGLARQIDVVAVIAAAGDEACVFLAAYRLSDACVHDAMVRVRAEWVGRRYSHSETDAATTLFRSFLRRAHGSGAAGRRKFLAPMLRDIGAGAKPDLVEAAHIVEELDQAPAAAGPADEPVMQADREQLWRAVVRLRGRARRTRRAYR